MAKKLILIITGVILLIAGLFTTFGILVYSLKENDYVGFYGFFISFGLIGIGIYSLVRGINQKLNSD